MNVTLYYQKQSNQSVKVMRISKAVVLIIVIFILLPQAANSRAAFELDTNKDVTSSLSAQETPAWCIVAHRIGKLHLAVNNNGTLGTGWPAGGGARDCITGAPVNSLEYPINSQVEYLFAAAFWIGAIVGRDTLVSTGADGWSTNGNEFRPDISPFGDLIYRTIRMPENPDLFEGAVSEEDYIATYADTFPYVDEGAWMGIQHRPLNIKVTQRSYAWSYSYAEDFVLFDYEIKNIGNTALEGVYMGFYNDSDVGFEAAQDYHTDDICGFTETFVNTEHEPCVYLDTVNLAWIADNDGDFASGPVEMCPHVTAMRIIRTPATELDVSFNWWISNGTAALDFGPREREGIGAWPEEFRDFGTGALGTPEGDRNKYYSLKNREFDYDQVFTASITSTDSVWMYPNQEVAWDLADGYDTRYLLSFGPFDIEPGEKLPISFAYVGGENFHNDPGNIDNLPDRPQAFYNGLDFTDLSKNSLWAAKVYDNPGQDPDSDGIYGEYRICCPEEGDPLCEDTIWYKGDGKPDFRGASPPPPPKVRLEPRVGAVRVLFNGLQTETTTDVFSRLVDFEGYRVYVGRDEREASFSMIASFDIEDYNKWVYDHEKEEWILPEVPYTPDQLKEAYGEDFDPLEWPRSRPFEVPGFTDSVCYFEPQDFNCSHLGQTTPIEKVYPDQPYPSSLVPSECSPDELTEDGFIKYFEYEIEIDSLLPSVEWWVNVTSFDFGWPESELEALESSRVLGATPFYPLSSQEQIQANDLKVYVYPNPYRFDGGYREEGFEGRLDTDRPDDRVREIHFANLPPKCTIRIYSLDGDLVRELEHDMDPSDPQSTHDTWDMITRNTQMAVSGLYFWTVESPDGETQIGKLVIIM